MRLYPYYDHLKSDGIVLLLRSVFQAVRTHNVHSSLRASSLSQPSSNGLRLILIIVCFFPKFWSSKSADSCLTARWDSIVKIRTSSTNPQFFLQHTIPSELSFTAPLSRLLQPAQPPVLLSARNLYEYSTLMHVMHVPCWHPKKARSHPGVDTANPGVGISK